MAMIGKRKLIAALIGAGFLLAACSGGGGGVSSINVPQTGSGTSTGATSPNTAPTAGAASALNIPYGQPLMAGASYVGPVTFGSMGIDVYTKMTNLPGLLQYAKDVNNPNSASYRQFLTPDEIAARFGTSQNDYQSLINYFASNGLAVAGWPQRMMLRINGSQSNLQHALGVTFGTYSNGRATFIAPTNAPRMAANLAVAGLGHIVGISTFQTDNIVVRGGNGVSNGYSAQQVAAAFDFRGAYLAGYNGAGINLGVIGTGGINIAGGGDVADYGALYNTPVAKVTIVPGTNANVSPGCTQNAPTPASPGPQCPPGYQYSSGLQTPPPVTAPCTTGTPTAPTPTCNPEDGEAQIDTEMTASLAPGANVLFYLAYNPAECFVPGTFTPGQNCNSAYGSSAGPAQGLSLNDDEIQQAIGDNQADVLSLSYGGGEALNLGIYFDSTGNGYGPAEFAALAAEGIAVFVSSGDSGSVECRGFGVPQLDNTYCTSYPATDPSVTSVGGVNVAVDGTGKVLAPITGWGYQTGLGGTPTGGAGSGGGYSSYFPLPAVQTGPNITGSFRTNPDIASIADPSTGVAIDTNAGPNLGGRQIIKYGGTSVAAPVSAAQWAIVLQACKQNPGVGKCPKAGAGAYWRLGDPKGYFYPIYNSAAYSTTIYDVVYGNNGAITNPSPAPAPSGPLNLYNAGPNYDLVTGIGVPFTRALIKTIAGV